MTIDGEARTDRLIDDMPVLRQELDELERENGTEPALSEAASRLSILLADEALVDRLAAKKFVGPEYDMFVDQLARYGLAVITAWTKSGAAFVRSSALRRPIAHRYRPDPMTHEAAVSIADMTVTYGLRLFRQRALVQQQWQRVKGASLRTYFIGSCLLTFSNACKAWRSDNSRSEIPVGSIADVIPHQRSRDDPAETAILRSIAKRILMTETRESRIVLVMTAAGYTQKEIAEFLGGTANERSVEGRLYRARQRLIRNQEGEEDAIPPGLR